MSVCPSSTTTRSRPSRSITLPLGSEAEEMVAVAVGDIDSGQVLAVRFDPLYQSVRLLDGEKGVDEDGVALTVDEGRRVRRPHQLFLARWQVAGNAPASCHEHVPVKLQVSRFDVSHTFLSLPGPPAGEAC